MANITGNGYTDRTVPRVRVCCSNDDRSRLMTWRTPSIWPLCEENVNYDENFNEPVLHWEISCAAGDVMQLNVTYYVTDNSGRIAVQNDDGAREIRTITRSFSVDRCNIDLEALRCMEVGKVNVHNYLLPKPNMYQRLIGVVRKISPFKKTTV